nr:fatty-acid amide hydrolase 2-A-like [Leptinotarsa decemlineata]XP_023017533.1 fatty-acid amide hydrolase 2-A-like [Leptinotarsa decemlineata]XP_023017534.1 fatty-acid amide hydrolase 2-A-like [Leptinotarsa decemlineata]
MSFKEFFYKCSLFLLRILRAITHPILVCKAKGKKQVLPPIKNDVLKISATDLARKIRRKELSSLEVCKAYIDRIQEVNPILNAVVEDRFELAIMDARNTDIYLSTCTLSEKELEETKPLLGVPLTVKESCCLKGLEYSVGHFPKAGTKAETDSEIVARLKASGAIPLLVSNNPELCMSIEAYNLITGTTNNPYDTTCTCGGSSGGEGALLGAGASVIGLGSDFAGSVRIPAAYNCVYGHKPTPRIASIKGHMPYVEYGKFKDIMVLGPMTRYVEDLKLMMNVIVDPGQTKNLRLNEKVDISKLNVFFMEDSGDFLIPSVDPEIKKAVKAAAQYLERQCGSTIMRNEKLPVKDAMTVFAVYLTTTEGIPDPLRKGDILVLEMFKALFGWSKYSLRMLYLLLQTNLINIFIDDHSKEVASRTKTFENKLGDNGVFLFPTMGASASKHDEYITTFPYLSYPMVANTLKLPATSIPCGLNKDGLPIGIQVMAGPNQDRLCLAVAEELDKYFGGWIPPY